MFSDCFSLCFHFVKYLQFVIFFLVLGRYFFLPALIIEVFSNFFRFIFLQFLKIELTLGLSQFKSVNMSCNPPDNYDINKMSGTRARKERFDD